MVAQDGSIDIQTCVTTLELDYFVDGLCSCRIILPVSCYLCLEQVGRGICTVSSKKLCNLLLCLYGILPLQRSLCDEAISIFVAWGKAKQRPSCTICLLVPLSFKKGDGKVITQPHI